MRMDKETKELFDALMKEFDRVEQKIYGRLNEMDNKLDTIQKDVNLLKARNDYLDLYALYNQLEKRIFDLEQRVS
jgi:peptidoglycan hydrolase CwlO-like protein